jgi:MFS family permease
MQRFMLSPDSLWRDRAFLVFWLARMISIAGSTITTVVLPILVFRLTGSPLQTSLLTTLEIAPYFIFGLFAGALADRVDRQRLMIACDLINTLLLGSIPLAAALDLLTLPQIYLVAPLSMTAFVWFDAANFGALPALVGRQRIVEANSAIWSTSTIIGIVGPALGGALAATIGPAPTISLDALSFALSAVLLVFVPRAFNQRRPTTDDRRSPGRGDDLWSVLSGQWSVVVADIREGLQFLWQHRLVRALTLLGFGNSLTGGAVMGLLVVYGVRALGLAVDDARIGWLFTASAVGALGASLALPWLKRRYPVGRITLFGLFANLALLIGLALAPSLVFGLALVLLWDATHTLIIINGIALRQQVTPDRLQSRVNTTARMIAWGGAPFGAALGGLIAEVADIRTAYLSMAIGVAASAALGWFSPLRERPAAPNAAETEVTM